MPTKKTTTKKTSKKRSTKKVVEETVAVEEPVEVQEPAAAAVAQEKQDETPKRERRVVDRESVVRDFDALLQTLEDHVEHLRSTDAKSRKNTGVKFVKGQIGRAHV